MKEFKLKVNECTTLLNEVNILFPLGIPFPTKYKVKRIIDTLTPIQETVEKMRISLLEKHGKLDEGGVQYGFENDEQRELFRKEYFELLENEETVQLQTFSVDEFSTVTNTENFVTIFKLIED